MEENDRQEAMAQLSSAVRESADMIRRLNRKVADLENRSKLKKLIREKPYMFILYFPILKLTHDTLWEDSME